ncbi:Helix-turn-helix domain-containing protein [Amycolatopsis marina]|uniref:Helix-turn-helix domain-containing protein n=1 Tax=Amycolatopsis marina TaxID=490629 RepID=A0A1I0WYU9_9PSEU|nr:AraC family transcriptional regulator [Amycolatopsis marina]SFA93256.1 Helix-turn-helix domain-containing protein [Amycolatopsis marina]
MSELAVPAVRDWDFPRNPASILLMSEFAREREVPVAELLRGSGLREADLRDPELQVDARQELGVVRALVAALGDDNAIAAELGRRYHVTTFGIFGFACISSPTLRDAMVFALRYLDLSFTFSIPHVTVDGAQVTLTLHNERVPEDVAGFLVLRDLAAIHTMMRDLLPAISLLGVELRGPRPAGVDLYLEVFGIEPSFESGVVTLTFDVAYLDRALPQANQHTVAMCMAQCAEMVARRRARTGIAHEVRERLLRTGPQTGMDQLARELTMSPRTLRRRLTEAGTSYRTLVDEVRQTLAEELLATGALSVEEVAVRLGYAEASSFIYAFRRWKGMTPSAYARERRPTLPGIGRRPPVQG